MEVVVKRISDDELMHYGVLGMKWGVRRSQKKLAKKVAKAHKLADDVERYQGRANAALESSKGHRLLSTKAQTAGDKRGAKTHDHRSKSRLEEYDRYEHLSKEAMRDYLKTKVSALYDSTKVENGKSYVESLAGRTISQNNIDKYETQYKRDKRYAEGYNEERRHASELIAKYSTN